MSTDALHRHSLNGPTMGTRWTAVFYAPPGFATTALAADLAAAADRVNRQMTTWSPTSDLMLLNAAPVGDWVALPPDLMTVLAAALRIGTASDGLFDINIGDLVTAWGFGPAQGHTDPARIRALAGQPRIRATAALELDPVSGCARKSAPLALDLSGIAKGHAVDLLAETCARHGVTRYLVGIDGELRAQGAKPDGTPWTVAVEAPDPAARRAQGVLELTDRAVATSGDYRHFVTVGDTRLSHSMNPRTGGPVQNRLASVSVLHPSCMEADAWATVLMVLGEAGGPALARARGIEAIFLVHDEGGLRQIVT